MYSGEGRTELAKSIGKRGVLNKNFKKPNNNKHFISAKGEVTSLKYTVFCMGKAFHGLAKTLLNLWLTTEVTLYLCKFALFQDCSAL